MHNAFEKLSFIHFADDTTIFRSGSDLNVLRREINEELANVYKWLQANRLSLNVSKTKCMLFTHERVNPSALDVTIDGCRIKFVNNIKFLDLSIDDKLKYNYHCSDLARKLSYSG